MLGYFFFQAEDGIRDLVRSRGLGDVYKRQILSSGGNMTFDTSALSADTVTVNFGTADGTATLLSLIHI